MAKLEEVKNLADFDKILDEVKGNLVVVHFRAEWAPQCQQLTDVMTELAKDTNMVNCRFIEVEAESVPEMSMRYKIVAVPTCILIKNKEVVDRVDGANVAELNKKVQHHSSATSSVTLPKAAPPKEDLNSRLKRLINTAPVMLFMKGDPQEPRCGFSKTTVQMLNDEGVKFSSFDILSDEEVRQGLKTYSDWPTFPQLYLNGELAGGLDILKELVESGELKEMLPKQESLDDRLKALINKAPVMLFMKGDRDGPRCGFSKTIIGILNDTTVPYQTFDILGDEEVRQGLKVYSDWPTYPQLYVKGEMVGGLDIIKEMLESGDLEATLKGDQ